MKFISLAIIFIGVVLLLKNVGVQISWGIIGPIALIFVGISLKHLGHIEIPGMGRWSKGICKDGVCEGENCGKGGCGSCKK